MKKMGWVAVVTGIVTILCVSVSIAGQNTGCGLGTLVIPGDKDSVIMQVLQATTNGTFGTQTFGITSGTSNCVKPNSIASTEKLEKFVAANMDTLAKDIAGGHGEALDTVAELLQIPTADRSRFCATLKDNFSRIYTSEKIQSGEVIDHIIEVIS